MAAVQSALQKLVDDYMHQHVNLNAPDWYINPEFKVVMQGEAGRSICNATPLSFAPGLLEVLQSPTPPSPDYWLSTPKPDGKLWGVYAALLTKDGCEPALCIGSGTEASTGYKIRISQYYDKRHPLLPRFVRLLYDKGYDLAHIGLICWSPIPKVSIIPRARRRFLAIEGTFINIFYSAIPTIMDGMWTHFMPWSRDDVLWRPLNSHTPFKETAAGDLKMTAEELLLAEEERKKRRVHMLEKMREVYDRERAQDIDAFRLKKRLQAISWVARNKAKVSEINKRSKQKALKTNRFHCECCNKSFADRAKLTRHNDTDRHKIKASGVRPRLTAKQRMNAGLRAQILANKTFHCEPCNQTFDGQFHLDKHKLTQKHLTKVASQHL
ncbi:H(+)-transporting V1 sector ATPase subunit A [Cadophora gregata]|uniref:H(+)-transporting V1 sector ATPase subunit A n=1 Tax=Cadophora gregata TaxID=51156 RepID=UPI0026DC2411|nr:H(+)-transporting V1 sector ATPase subunit A [Cadophora gregata]KAK0119869.1 H(+)-transporting V1 sector ATPase subunit A [Cadophora gregata]KAK0120904.1 H(+)-transporting V1 sector ATPase subunit A [Cadophora gregata f. sp. sojae]